MQFNQSEVLFVWKLRTLFYVLFNSSKSTPVRVKSKQQKERDTTRIHSYIQRKIIIRALLFSGMISSALIQYLIIAENRTKESKTENFME